jgi:hypothetical protein
MSGYRHWAGRRILGGKSLQLYWQLFHNNFLGIDTVLAEKRLLEVYLLPLYWQLYGSNFLGSDTVLAEKRLLEVCLLPLYWQLYGRNFLGSDTVPAKKKITWRWVSWLCTGSCLAAISLVLTLYWQKRIPGGGSPGSVLAAVWQQYPWYKRCTGRRVYLESGLLQLYWQLYGSSFFGTETVMAEENTWGWVSCSCTGSCMAAISLVMTSVLAAVWQQFPWY